MIEMNGPFLYGSLAAYAKKRQTMKPNAKDWFLNPDNLLLKPGNTWHGFKYPDQNYVLLDPIKVTILRPGIDKNEEGDANYF